jgi:hypothetical protein
LKKRIDVFPPETEVKEEIDLMCGEKETFQIEFSSQDNLGRIHDVHFLPGILA